MYAAARERAQEHRQCSYKGFTFTGCHFGDFALVQHYTAYELYVVVYHIPAHGVAAGQPGGFPYSFVAFDGYEVAALAGEFAVECCGCHFHGVGGSEACCGFGHSGEYLGQVFVEFVLEGVEYVLFVFVDFVPQGLALVVGKRFDFYFQTCDFVVVGMSCVIEVGTHGIDAAAELVDSQLLELGAFGLDFLHNGHYGLEVALRLIAEQFA